MSGGGRPKWWKVGGLGILLFLAIYGLVALESKEANKGDERRTTYSAAAGGYKALYLWLDELNLPVKRWERTLRDLPAEATVLVMAEPELTPSKGELKSLKKWIAHGGTFVHIARQANLFWSDLGFELEPVFVMQHLQDKKEPLRFQPGPYTRGIRTLTYINHPRLSSSRPHGIVHLRSAGGGLLMVLDEGKGRVIGLTDPSLFANGSLRDGDHARLALNLLLTHRGNGELLMDEYHHGYGRATSVLEHLFSSRALVPLLQGILILLVLWVGKGRRFGPPRPLLTEERSSSLEYVRAMARLYQRAKVRALALKAVVRWIEEEAKNILVHRDRNLQNKLLNAKQHLEIEDTSEKELLKLSRDLYLALEAARRRAIGSTLTTGD
jgi:hypothetical protein